MKKRLTVLLVLLLCAIATVALAAPVRFGPVSVPTGTLIQLCPAQQKTANTGRVSIQINSSDVSTVHTVYVSIKQENPTSGALVSAKWIALNTGTHTIGGTYRIGNRYAPFMRYNSQELPELTVFGMFNVDGN